MRQQATSKLISKLTNTCDEPIRAKITVDGNITKQVSTFKYLSCEISYSNNIDVEDKLNRFHFFCNTIRFTLCTKVSKKTLLQLHMVTVVPPSLYGYDTWTLGVGQIRIGTAKVRVTYCYI
jgi:hypothetical protein